MVHRLLLVALLLGVGLTSPLLAQPWTATEGGLVSATNPEGYTFEIGPLSGRRALCTFRLPAEGADELGGRKAPDLRVDGYDAQTVVAWPDPEEEPEDGGDFMEAARRSAGVAPLVSASAREVRFACWEGLPRQEAPTRGVLRRVMDGEELVVSFARDDDSLGETSFALEGVRELIVSTFGLAERPSEADLLQDALLRLRVEYRGSTCYLLAGKKNQKRCLEAVNTCAQRSHDSLVSMLGCIEVE